jgi:diaminohydroxyphosphoribosylaminopyrimidine deaminase/5-amino-6-(5-phosphoribosylamino)uracil reductase
MNPDTSSSLPYEDAMMQQALQQARAVKGSTWPNPPVGALIVRNHEIVARGATRPCGGDHAEIVALKTAGETARGADMFVTLEPCAHHGRTPPCTEAIIRAGPARVFVAMRDPNPRVDGAGVRALRSAGITVKEEIAGSQARHLLEEYTHCIRTGLSWVTLKLALSWDGKIADRHGRSQWITNEKSRTAVHRLRCEHAAVAVGKNTYLTDDPRLTVRHCAGTQPVRVVLADPSCARPQHRLLQNTEPIRTIFVSTAGDHPHIHTNGNGTETWYTAASSRAARIDTFLSMAAQEGLVSILLEGGARCAGRFFEHGRVNRVYFFYGNRILGDGIAPLSTESFYPMDRAPRLVAPHIEVLDDNVMVTGLVETAAPAA